MAAQNYLITQFYNQIGDIIFYALIEYRTINISMGLSWIIFSISFVLLSVLLISLLSHFKLLQEYHKIKQKANKDEENLELEEFIQDHQGYQVLFGDFKDDSLKHQAFLLIFTIYDLSCYAELSTQHCLNILLFRQYFSSCQISSKFYTCAYGDLSKIYLIISNSYFTWF